MRQFFGVICLSIEVFFFIGVSLIIFSGQENMSFALIELGANVNAEDENKDTFLHTAASRGIFFAHSFIMEQLQSYINSKVDSQDYCCIQSEIFHINKFIHMTEEFRCKVEEYFYNFRKL